MHFPHPKAHHSTHKTKKKTTLLPNWHQELIIQLLIDTLAPRANQNWVARPAAANLPDDLEKDRRVELEISTEEQC